MMKGRRIVWPSAKRVVVEAFDAPTVQPGTVLVETECTAVSPGTELAFLQANTNTCSTFPQYPGYSGVGRILEVGDGVEGFSVGERVIMDHCGHAGRCLQLANMNTSNDGIPGWIHDSGTGQGQT